MELLHKVLEGIQSVDQDVRAKASSRVDSLVKPIGSLGKLENLTIQLAGITGKVKNDFSKKAVIVMAADNGVVEENVASAPQSITAMQTVNMLKGITGVSVLSKEAGADVKIIDIGINAVMGQPGLINRKIRMGTNNIAKGPAMSREEAIQSIEIGIQVVKEAVEEGYTLLGTGEMGIGNTTTTSAMTMAFLGCSANEAVGKGAGLTEEGYELKKKVIIHALEINTPNLEDPLDVLTKVGGFDIGGLVGCFLGAAYYQVPIVIDGVISAIAAFTAYRLNPLVKEYMIPSHQSLEPVYQIIMNKLELEPMLYMNMRLGEGSGCPLAFHLIDGACAMMNNMATFEEASIADDFLVDIRS